MTPDGRALVDALAFTGHTMRQRDLAYALWGLDGSIRRVQSACQEARLAGWPIVSDGDGMRLEDDPAAVAMCALALRSRAIHQLLTARALRRTASRMREAKDASARVTLWDVGEIAS